MILDSDSVLDGQLLSKPFGATLIDTIAFLPPLLKVCFELFVINSGVGFGSRYGFSSLSGLWVASGP